MASVLDSATDEQVREELARRAEEKGGGGVAAFLKRLEEGSKTVASGLRKGAVAGSVTALTFPADIAAALGNLVTPMPSPGEEVKKYLGVNEQPKDSAEASAYNFAEGAVPGAAFGMLGGPIGAAVGATIGGTLNMTGKTFFPDNPLGQAAVNMAPLGVSAVRQAARAAMPKPTPKMIRDPETGTDITPGQASGNIEQLSKEEAMRRGLRTASGAENAYAAQNTHLTDFFNKIQKTSAKVDTNPETLVPVVYKAFEQKDSQLINTFKTANQNNFAAANRAGGGRAVIPTDNVLSKVDSLIASHNNPEVPSMQAVSSAWKRIKDAYLEDVPAGNILNASGNPIVPATTVQKNITVERLQQNLAAWADAAKNGTYTAPGKAGNMFEGIAPGQVKGFARQILAAYKADMDDAIKLGAPGAAELKRARDQFKLGLDNINEWAGHPIVKDFSVETLSTLHPEKTYKLLATLDNSQRTQAMAAIKAYSPDAWESIRIAAFQDKMQGAVSSTGIIDPKKAFDTFKGLGDKDLQYLFPTKGEQAEVKAGLAVLEQINRKNNFVSLSDEALAKALNEVASTAGAVWGAKGRYITKTVIDGVQSLMGRPQTVQQAAYLAFNPDGRALARAALSNKMNLDSIPKGSVEQYIQLSPFGRKVAVPAAVTGATNNHAVVPEIDQSEYEREARLRGLIK